MKPIIYQVLFIMLMGCSAMGENVAFVTGKVSFMNPRMEHSQPCLLSIRYEENGFEVFRTHFNDEFEINLTVPTKAIAYVLKISCSSDNDSSAQQYSKEVTLGGSQLIYDFGVISL